ncbi:arylsulfatase B-like [Arctopsyche grandis]|uniref:arylsulfatase B-like n=1 Tax=Arctopsyche grandis TaxID=121162 RepID=UPI00406D8B6C
MMKMENIYYSAISILLLSVVHEACGQSNQRPHIVFIIADDLGWNDVGFHGSNQIPTPNIDALAYSGLILNNYYVNPICTPSRSALMTGKYPIHTGMQHTVLFGAEPRGLPLKEKILPEYLKELGYSTHLVGKWHLGSYKKEYTPLYRGFDTHIGYWTGHQDYYDHFAEETGFLGLDMRRGMETAWDLHGQYSTDLFTSEAVKLIQSHNTSKPMFLYLAHAAVHSGNKYNPLPAPDETVAKFPNITNYSRRRFAAMTSKLDDSVGNVMEALSANNMLSNSIVIFTTDNGGPAEGFNLNAASNWPLKGVKNTLWEGGVRGAALVWSPFLEKRQRVALQRMHITDWLPTLYTAAGGDSRRISKTLDAIDMWKALSEDRTSERNELLHNIDDIWGSASLTVGDWKVHIGSNYNGQYDKWYGPSGLQGIYDIDDIIKSKSGKALNKLNEVPEPIEISKIRQQALVNCSIIEKPIECNPFISPCLFNIKEDPCEFRNLAFHHQYEPILNDLLVTMAKYNATAVPPGNLPIDPKGDPALWQYTWTNFGDYSVVGRTNA